LSRLSRDQGLAARHWDAARFAAAEAVLDRVDAEGIETVRIVFADQHGITRGKTVTARGLRSALEAGIRVPSTLLLKDTSHATVFPIWAQDAGFGGGVMTGASDVVLLPDPTTFQRLDWADGAGWMLADLYHPSGEAVEISSRGILARALDRLAEAGMELVAGLEVEFTILKVENPRLDHAAGGFQEEPPETSLLAHGYQHLTESRMDQLEPILTRLRREAEALGMPVRSVEAEFGPSQVEFVFDPLPAMDAADMMVLFRSMVKQVCTRAGLHASFMARPGFKGAMGAGWHLHLSAVDLETGANRFMDGQGLSDTASGWIAGVLQHARAGCLLTTPTVTGYKRYQPHQLAPDRVAWGRDNRGAMLRVLTAEGDPASRIENRVGEPMANPYFYIASQVLTGLDGVARGARAPAPSDTPYSEAAEALPRHLGEAIEAFSASAFYRAALGDAFVDYLCHLKRAEWDRYLAEVSAWEMREYFPVF